MNTAYPIWTELAILASRPGGWVIPVMALFALLGGVWALFNRIGRHIDFDPAPHRKLLDEVHLEKALDPLRPSAPSSTTESQKPSPAALRLVAPERRS